ncbi:hypothetical protein MST22_05860 [Virgibacillus halodenitrificans]|uniref:hypothetical protein n=1 Tax=Virgibacillus halodenitrificans TaxID=1482 RepID=UPI001FB22E34|nr:hypothetical protein [Virgibacillus halodenitrificans]MCJ0930675.1 hypothetical protein [Virgibacillus halodenitrificans]
MKEAISILLIIGIGIILYKKGILRFMSTKKINYTYKKLQNSLKVRYKKFTGIEYYYFKLKKGVSYTLKFDVTVEEGALDLEWRSFKGVVDKKRFEADGNGELTVTASTRLHSVRLEGSDTKGGCVIEVVQNISNQAN